jgi:hypothetical protein
MVVPFAQWRWSNCLPPIFRTFVWTVKYFDPDLKKINPGSRKPEEALTKGDEKDRRSREQRRFSAGGGRRRQAAQGCVCPHQRRGISPVRAV